MTACGGRRRRLAARAGRVNRGGHQGVGAATDLRVRAGDRAGLPNHFLLHERQLLLRKGVDLWPRVRLGGLVGRLTGGAELPMTRGSGVERCWAGKRRTFGQLTVMRLLISIHFRNARQAAAATRTPLTAITCAGAMHRHGTGKAARAGGAATAAGLGLIGEATALSHRQLRARVADHPRQA